MIQRMMVAVLGVVGLSTVSMAKAESDGSDCRGQHQKRANSVDPVSIFGHIASILSIPLGFSIELFTISYDNNPKRKDM